MPRCHLLTLPADRARTQISSCPGEKRSTNRSTTPPHGDADESYYSSNQAVFFIYWTGPILDWEARSVGAPDDFVVHMRALALAKSEVNTALVIGINRSIWASVMHHAVHVLTEELGRVFIA